MESLLQSLKEQLQRLLIETVENSMLSKTQVFNGETCTAMLSFLECISLVRSTHDR